MPLQQNNPFEFDEEEIPDSTLSEVGIAKKRQTFYIRLELIEEVRAYAHRKRLRISEVVNLALDEFFAGKEVKEVKASALNRQDKQSR